MKFTLLTSVLAAASSVVAAPAPEPVSAVEGLKNPFGLMTLRSASPIHFAGFSASKGSLQIALKKGKQAAKCDKYPEGVATFYTKNGGLYLYNKSTKNPQKVYVDRSGMGQGKIGYVYENQDVPRNAETIGWKTTKSGDYEYLHFKGQTLLACPGGRDGSYSVWLDTGVKNPGGNKGCLGLSAMTLPFDKPADAPSCTYTK